MKVAKYLFLLLIFLIVFTQGSFAHAKTGFMVLAKDRGFLGNQEILKLFNDFKKQYPARLAFLGGAYATGGTHSGMGKEYSKYVEQALSELEDQGASRIVVIPLFLSDKNALLTKVAQSFPAYGGRSKIEWAPAMASSYLTSQILLDRINAISKNPKEERLMILGLGAIDKETQTAIENELKGLGEYVRQFLKFKEIKVGVYYGRFVEEKIRNEANGKIDQRLVSLAAKTGDTLVIPFFIGPKFSHLMSMTGWVSRKYKKMELDIVSGTQSILPHDNVLTWLKKTANRHMQIPENEVGVLIMPHGSVLPYNRVIEQTIAPLQKKYTLEIAYGMADKIILEEAVRKLEEKGMKKIIFVRMYGLKNTMKDKTDFILGISSQYPRKGVFGPMPSQISTSLVFESFGGYEEDPLIAEIIYERIKEISEDPPKETVLILAHGSGNEKMNQKWLDVINSNVKLIQKKFGRPFREIEAATLREDWPRLRQKALVEIKKMIKNGNKNGGRVVVISNRLYGSGPYKEVLDGEKYVINEKGFAPHPNITRWLKQGIERVLKK